VNAIFTPLISQPPFTTHHTTGSNSVIAELGDRCRLLCLNLIASSDDVIGRNGNYARSYQYLC